MLRYEREDGCRAWLTHARSQPRGLADLYQRFLSAEAIYDAVRREGEKPLKEYLSPANARRLVETSKPETMHRMMIAMRDSQMQVVALDDPDYPPSLAAIDDPPVFLFAVGETACMQRRCLAVVGARRATPRAFADCRNICQSLSEHGVTIVSGLAVGIDTAAHEGSLSGPTPGIGVAACGLDVDYPTASSGLKRELLEHGGLLLSECPPGTRPFKGVFNMRNRVISGLSKGVAVIECQIRSGTMTTVDAALTQGREVFARPGDPGSEYSEGTRSLLRDGARFFQLAEDILEDLGWNDDPVTAGPALPEESLTPDMRLVLKVLHTGVRGFDELANETGLDVGSLSISLTMLQMTGHIMALPGKTYSVV